jgi:hypothetical protein
VFSRLFRREPRRVWFATDDMQWVETHRGGGYIRKQLHRVYAMDGGNETKLVPIHPYAHQGDVFLTERERQP